MLNTGTPRHGHHLNIVVSIMLHSDHCHKHLQTHKTQKAAIHATKKVDEKMFLTSSLFCVYNLLIFCGASQIV